MINSFWYIFQLFVGEEQTGGGFIHESLHEVSHIEAFHTLLTSCLSRFLRNFHWKMQPAHIDKQVNKQVNDIVKVV